MHVDRLFKVLVVGGSLLAASCASSPEKTAPTQTTAPTEGAAPASAPASQPEAGPAGANEGDKPKDGVCAWF